MVDEKEFIKIALQNERLSVSSDLLKAISNNDNEEIRKLRLLLKRIDNELRLLDK